MAKFIKSLYIKNYRGIGGEAQKLHDLKRINLFVGANNAGKSTVLKLVNTVFPLKVQPNTVLPRSPIDALDKHQGASESPIIGYGHPVEQVIDYAVKSNAGPTDLTPHREIIARLLHEIADDRDIIWWEVDLQTPALPQLQSQHISHSSLRFEARDWNILQTGLTRFSGGGIDSMRSAVLSAISAAFSPTAAQTHLIPAIREVGEKGGSFDLSDMSGVGLT